MPREALDDWAAYVVAMAREVIESIGPRPPASEGETRAQLFVRDQLRSWVDGTVEVERFRVAPKAFMSMPQATGLLLAAATICQWGSPWLTAGFSLLAVLVILFELILYRPFLDPLCRKRTSHNVIAVQAPSGNITRRLVLNAHPDAAYEWRLLCRFPAIFPLLMFYSLVGLMVIICVDLLRPFFDGAGTAGAFGTAIEVTRWAFVPSILVGLTFTSFSRVSPGANDNLSGVFAITGLARYLRQTGIRLDCTELVYLVTGSEEAGLRGAKAYLQRHAAPWRDVPTILITLDTLRDLEHLKVYNRDRNGLVQHNAAVCSLLHDAGSRCGLELDYATVILGASDAAAFSEVGIASAALCAMDPRPADYYHNRRDHWDNMSVECIRKTCELLLDAVRQYDRHGLARPEPNQAAPALNHP